MGTMVGSRAVALAADGVQVMAVSGTVVVAAIGNIPGDYDKFHYYDRLPDGGSEAQYGDDFGKMGQYVEHPDVEVDWSQYFQHGLEQMEKRGLTKEMVDSFVKKALSQSNGEKFAFVTKEGSAVVTKDGKLITAWGSDDFDNNMVEIIKKLFGD